MIATTERLQSWLTEFHAFDQRALGPAWLRTTRQQAFARFSELGFPTVKNEDWRFTSVQPIANTAFQLAHGRHQLTRDAMAPYRIPGVCCQLVFVNGRFAPALSDTAELPKKIVSTSLIAALEREPEHLERHLARYEDARADAFTALNTAFLADGAYLHVPRGTVVEQPIAFLYVTAPEDGPEALMTHPRNLIVVEEDAQVEVVEDYVSLPAPGLGSASEGPALASFSNVITELIVGDNGVVSHYLVEREDRRAANISTLRIQQGHSANVASHSILIGGALVRNNVHPVLAGEGGECLINGLFIGAGRQHLDNYMKVEHQSPHCGSRQFYNGILDERARGVFHGRIIVSKAAQKTDAKQTNRNLLLSDDAQIDTKPQLEIYADDVKCTHGATIGQIDESALFYLRARGIPEVEARGLLLYAFAHECLDRMKAGPVRSWLDKLVTASLPARLAPTALSAARRTAGRRNLQEVG